MKERFDPRLQVITDRTAAGKRTLELVVEQAILGGATMIQLRMKDPPANVIDIIALGHRLHEVTSRYGVPLIVNDSISIAKVTGAKGLHVGQSDLPVADARALLGPDKILGVSVSNVAEALQAQRDGADYLGVGPVFRTYSKQDAGEAIGLERLREIVKAVSIPVVGIGGINMSNARSVVEVGVSGVAVISAVMGAADPREAAQELYSILANSKH